MKPIKFECPYCHEINVGDESLYGQKVECRKCQAAILVPSPPATAVPATARLIQEPGGAAPVSATTVDEETEVFQLRPTARAFLGQILLGLLCLGLAVALETSHADPSWSTPAALSLAGLGVLLLVLVWTRVKSRSYRLTTQRLFVRRGWLAKHVDELELYRVKDVVIDQGILPRLLGYGTIGVLADDDTTPRLDLVRISRPTTVKETIRTHYRAARRREGVHPTEFMQSP